MRYARPGRSSRYMCLTPRTLEGKTPAGFPKTGIHRTRFLLESVRDLRQQLRERGSELIVRWGKPENEIFNLARELRASWVFCNRERTAEEVQVQDRLEQNLWSIGREMRYSRGKMLLHTQDLPFPVTHTPEVFTHYRKEVDRIVPIRSPLPVPTLPEQDWRAITPETIPSLTDMGWPSDIDEQSVRFPGGETAGLARLNDYLWGTDAIAQYKETRNQLLGDDYSSKFSPYLAHGCLSPKMIYAEIARYEQERVKNDSTYWLYFELLWRDFFRLMGKKHGNAIFQSGGIRQAVNPHLQNDRDLLESWTAGKTGVPFIDANMRELLQTGYMSNRGRQNVASFLVKDLQVNWRWGAEYFESMLVDYDPCSNWGNWNYVAGIGNDPREGRYFNILTQAQRYDPEGKYVRHWLPELSSVPTEYIHTPDRAPAEVWRRHKAEHQVYQQPVMASDHWQP